MESDILSDIHVYRRIYCTGCGYSFDVPLSCHNRFCEVCSAPRRRRVRSRLISIVSHVQSLPGYKIRFLTLTIPVQSDLSAAAKILISGFRKLRQRRFWKSRVKGGCYVLEVKGTLGRWHLHLHSLIDSRFLDVYRLSIEWNKCTPGKIVYVKNVPLAAVIHYVTKYICKSNLPLDDQLAASLALRGTRLFQPFGTWEAFSVPSDQFLWCCPKCDHSTFLPASILDRAFTDPYAKYVERIDSLRRRKQPIPSYEN